MENKIFVILDEDKQMYFYIVVNSLLEDSEINKIIKKLYFDLLKEDDDFSDSFEYELKKIKRYKGKFNNI